LNFYSGDVDLLAYTDINTTVVVLGNNTCSWNPTWPTAAATVFGVCNVTRSQFMFDLNHDGYTGARHPSSLRETHGKS